MRRAVVLIVAAVLAAVPAMARAPEEAVLPEVGVGLAAAFGGMYVGWATSSSVAGLFPDNPALSRQLRMATILGGMVLGASGGVAVTGTLLGVDGNLPLCFLGGVMGIGVGYLLSIPLYILADVDLDLVLLPVAAVALAVWGFNHRATAC